MRHTLSAGQLSLIATEDRFGATSAATAAADAADIDREQQQQQLHSTPRRVSSIGRVVGAAHPSPLAAEQTSSRSPLRSSPHGQYDDNVDDSLYDTSNAEQAAAIEASADEMTHLIKWLFDGSVEVRKRIRTLMALPRSTIDGQYRPTIVDADMAHAFRVAARESVSKAVTKMCDRYRSLASDIRTQYVRRTEFVKAQYQRDIARVSRQCH